MSDHWDDFRDSAYEAWEKAGGFKRQEDEERQRIEEQIQQMKEARARKLNAASAIRNAYQLNGLSGALEALSYLTEPTSLDHTFIFNLAQELKK